MTDSELYDKAFDYNDTDLRYKSGIVYFYQRMASFLTGKPEETFRDASEAFLDKTSEWHTNNRWKFEIHPDWRKEILSSRQSGT